MEFLRMKWSGMAILLIIPLIIGFYDTAEAAQRLEVGCPETNAMIVIDPGEDVIHRGDLGEKMELPIQQQPVSDMVLVLSSGAYDPAGGEVTLHLQFRLIDIDPFYLSHYVVGAKPVRIEGLGVTLETMDLTITSTGTTTQGETFAEFTATINTSTGYRRQNYTLWLAGEIPVKFTLYRLWESLEMVDANREGGFIDHWFQITETAFPSGCVEGAPTSAYSDFTMVTVPLQNADVTISGENALFEPTQTVTDDQGIFGVAAYRDPASFDQAMDSINAGGDEAALLINVKNSIRRRGLKGTYCEVIMVEGVVRVKDGTGTVKQGDILRPGAILTLRTGWGSRAQIALRFINGSKLQVISDVYTNACLSDTIKIGWSGIENLDTIQGKLPLASLTRTLCEKLAGFPSTPEQWAKSVGRVSVTTAVSLVVPGSGLVGFGMRYIAKDQAGKLYDRVVTNGSPDSMMDLAAGGSGDPRGIIDLYYDGSSRVAGNLGSIQVYENSAGAQTPFMEVQDGQWVEMKTTVGRTWTTPIEQIDGQGPDLRLGCEAYPDIFVTRYRLSAFDLAGIDASSLSVQVNGNSSTAFTSEDGETWTAEFSGVPPVPVSMSFSIRDNSGNESVMDWSRTSMPGEPVLEKILPGCWDAGATFIGWDNPTGMDATDIMYHEVRQIWRVNPIQWSQGPWLSVGQANEIWLEVPDNVSLGTDFYIEVRTFDQTGASGFAARSDTLEYAETQPFMGQSIGAPIHLLLHSTD